MKHNAKKCTYDNIIFDSLTEGDYYLHLKLLKQAGEVINITVHPKFILQKGFKKNGLTHEQVSYSADFLVEYNDGTTRLIDIKGSLDNLDPVFKLKRKIFENLYPNENLYLIGRDKRTKQWIDLEEHKRKKPKEKKSKNQKKVNKNS